MRSRAERLQDQILILESRSGDRGALGRLVSRWQARVYWYIWTLLEDEGAAWDVSQEVWLGAVSGLSERRPIQNFSAWLYGIAHNKAISHLRKKGRIDKRETILSDDHAESHEDDEDPVCKAEDARLVHECLNDLPVTHRSVLVLYYLNDLSLEEIAHILDVPAGTVGSRLHHGRQKMKELLLKRGYGDGQ